MTETPREQRARLLEESSRQARAALAARFAGNPYNQTSAADALASAQAEAAARAKAHSPPRIVPKPVRVALPPQVQAAAGIRVVNPKVWDSDVERLKRGKRDRDKNGYYARVREALRARRKGDPLPATIDKVAQKLDYFCSIGTSGGARVTFAVLATTCAMCVETTRKAIRFLEAHGVIDTFNVITRSADGDVWRAPNLYFLRDGAPDKHALEPLSVMDRVTDRLRRYAAAFGLKARAWGLNATPLRGPAQPVPVEDSG